MKEFIVCYTLDHDIKRERILKERDVEKEEVVQELLDKILDRKFIIAKSDQGDCRIHSSSIRYIRVL